jgi:Domain of unknown function (DUF929)
VSILRKFVLPVGVALCLAISAGGAVAAPADANYAPLTHKVVHEITSVTPETLAAVGAGRHGHANDVPPGLAHQGKLTAHGKPEVAYILAEFCPYCAAENWSMAVALSRFGTFHGLTTMTSSTSDIGGGIETMSFRYSRFRSSYLDFDPIVAEGAPMQKVDTVPPKVRKAWKHYAPEGFPFVDFDGKAVVTTSAFDPTLLSELTRAQIAGDLSQPKLAVAKAIDGGANQITAAVCLVTKERPGSVCDTKTIAEIQRSLKPANS